MTKYFCDFKGCDNEVKDTKKISISRQNPNRVYFRFHACDSCNIHLWKSLTDDLKSSSRVSPLTDLASFPEIAAERRDERIDRRMNDTKT